MTKNKWYIVIAVIIAAAVVGWLIWGRDSGTPGSTASPSPTLLFSPLPDNGRLSPTPDQTGELPGNQWQGTLRPSNNPARGNLILLTRINNFDNVIYIRTARDFSALIDKEVVVTYDGRLESFRLVNIEAK
ncbi:MAG: hypothetical protein AAB566_00045 [Patescibacteria group bacterium]